MTEPEFSIKKALEEAGTDAYLMTGNIHNSDIYYVTHFLASDDFVYLQTGAGEEILFISEMEKGRAEIESRVSIIKTTQDFGYQGEDQGEKRCIYRLCSLHIRAAHGRRDKESCSTLRFSNILFEFPQRSRFFHSAYKKPVQENEEPEEAGRN